MAEPEGVSTRYLLGAFFAVVLLCAVFFSLGYFLGYREGHPSGAPQTQAVGATTDSPPPANSSAAPPALPGAVQPNGTEPDEEESAASDSANGSQPAQENVNPAQSDAAMPAKAASSSPAVRAGATPVRPAADTEAGQAPPAESGAASDTDESSLYPRSLPSGVLIQVSAVANRQQASRVADALRSRGYPALVLTPSQVGARDTFFRVVAGPYKTRTAAGSALKQLTREGYRPFIRQ